MTNKALFFGYVAVLSVQFRAAAANVVFEERVDLRGKYIVREIRLAEPVTGTVELVFDGATPDAEVSGRGAACRRWKNLQ